MPGDIDIQFSFGDNSEGGLVLDFSSLTDAFSQTANADGATPASLAVATVDTTAGQTSPDTDPAPPAPPVDDGSAATGGGLDGLSGSGAGTDAPVAASAAKSLLLADFHQPIFGAGWGFD